MILSLLHSYSDVTDDMKILERCVITESTIRGSRGNSGAT